MTFYSNVKQKSYVLNPRGKPLYEDSNRFGTKMLEKMGWSKGKGLGMKEDGEQNFIRVSHKIDQKGMGYHDRDDQWTSHENQFNSLLKALDNSANASSDESSGDSDEYKARTGFGFSSETSKPSAEKSKTIKSKLSGNSLEQMSKKSTVRVHYRKFTRGKDTSRYSEKDLANIFGKKCDNEDETPMETTQPEPQEEQSPAPNYGITTIETGTTIQDYFTKKKKSRTTDITDEPTQSEPLVEMPEKKRRKKDKEIIADTMQPSEIETIVVDQSPLPKKEKKKKKSKKEPTAEVETIVVSEENSDCEIVSIETRKKKKKKSKKQSNEMASECAKIEESIGTTVDADTAETETKKKKRDKNKSKKETTATVDAEVNTIESKSIDNTQFIDDILKILVRNNDSAPSSTALGNSNAENNSDDDDEDDDTDDEDDNRTGDRRSQSKTNSVVAMDEVFEINRYHAEMFRFVNLDGFPNANLSDLSGYGYSKDIELKISEKSKDQSKINDLWDYALINKYGTDVIKAKKSKRYSMKQLKKKNLFMNL